MANPLANAKIETQILPNAAKTRSMLDSPNCNRFDKIVSWKPPSGKSEKMMDEHQENPYTGNEFCFTFSVKFSHSGGV